MSGNVVASTPDAPAQVRQTTGIGPSGTQLEQTGATEGVLAAYLDRMEHLLLQYQLRDSSEDSDVRAVARQRTLRVLPMLDGKRKGHVLWFLHESRLIRNENVVIDLSSADFREVWVIGDNLRSAHLRLADMSGGEFSNVSFREANLRRTRLKGAHLMRARMVNADLSRADLTGADLTGADLSGAVLDGTIFKDAKVSADQLAKAKSRSGTVKPDGTVYGV